MKNSSGKDTSSGLTLHWLEERFRHGVGEGRYLPFQPIYGYGGRSEGGQVTKYVRLLQILKRLNLMRFASFLDVGGAEGFTANLVRKIFQPLTLSTDLSAEACSRCQEFYGIPTLAVNASSLPFKDNSFDVVLLSEVIEHLEDPALAILEGLRVCRKALIITTDEMCLTRTERVEKMSLADYTRPHEERTYFTPDDFYELLGLDILLQATMHFGGWDGTDPPSEEMGAVRELILRLASRTDLVEGAHGILVVKEKIPGGKGHGPRISPRKLLRRLLEERVATVPGAAEKRTAKGGRDCTLLNEKICCPQCRGDLAEALTTPRKTIHCAGCAAEYGRQDGVTILRSPSAKAANMLRGKEGESYSRLKEELEAIPPISRQPACLESIQPLTGITETDGLFGETAVRFFVWGNQHMSFSFSADDDCPALAVTLCSHLLYPPLQLVVHLDGATLDKFSLSYGWQKLILHLPPLAAAKHRIDFTFDRPLDPGQLTTLRETVPGLEQMPEGTAVRLHRIKPLTRLDLLQQKLEVDEIRISKLMLELRALTLKQTHLENLLPIRIYKKLRGIEP